MDLGGYDHGYEISYRIAPIGRVNYELREYELYDEDFISKDQLPEFLAAIDARGFTDVGYHEEEDEMIDENEDNALQNAYRDIEANWDGQLDWVDDKEFTFALSYYNDGDDIGEVTDWMKDLAKEYGLKCDSTHDGHYVFWKEDMVNEASRKMRFRKIVKESDEGGSDHPRIYVGTYAKYNDGSIDGKWIDISEYNTYEEFVDACRELHKDEKDPEFMVQDYENFPRAWYHESGLPTEEEFNKINDFYMMDDDRKEAYEVYVNYTDDDDIDHFQEAYQGHFNSTSDFAYDLVDGIGWDGGGQENLDMYFDYDAFGRDLMMDYHMGDEDNEDAEGNPEDPDHYYDNDGYDMGEYESDQQVAYDYIDNIGGVNQLGPDTARNYFDYEAFGRDLFINDYWEDDGYVFLRM